MSSSGSEYYDILNETWQEVKFKITETQNLKLAVVSDLIYGVCKTKAFYYNPKTDFGQLIGSPSTDVHTVYSICSFNNQLHLIDCKYVLFHRNQNIHFIVYDKFNAQTNRWSRFIPVETYIKAPGVVVLDEELHLMGGTDSNSILYYNTKTGYFETKSGEMNSSKHYDTQAFVVDTESINPNNIMKYYSSNEI